MKACNLHTDFGPYPNDRTKSKQHQEVITAAASTDCREMNINIRAINATFLFVSLAECCSLLLHG